MKGRAAALAALLLAGLLAPDAAHACAVCTGNDSAAVSWALLKGTALLSLTPLAIIGGGVWYLRRRARQIAASEAERAGAERPAAPSARTA